MTGRRPFIDMIREYPDDNGPRLVYADWCEERGETLQAELIRLGCELADPPRPLITPRTMEVRSFDRDDLFSAICDGHELVRMFGIHSQRNSSFRHSMGDESPMLIDVEFKTSCMVAKLYDITISFDNLASPNNAYIVFSPRHDMTPVSAGRRERFKMAKVDHERIVQRYGMGHGLWSNGYGLPLETQRDKSAWVPGIAEVVQPKSIVTDRGLVKELTCSRAYWDKYGDEIMDRHPVDRVTVGDRMVFGSPDEIKQALSLFY